MASNRQENFYEAFLNEDDEIMFAISARDSKPSNPRIIYDGGKHALFYRDEENSIILDFIHPDIRQALINLRSVLISEVRGDKIIREYDVLKQQVNKLPVSSNSIVSPSIDIDEDLLKRK